MNLTATSPTAQNPLGLHPGVLRMVDQPKDRALALPVLATSIPAEMERDPRWVAWHYVKRDGKWTKIPFIATDSKREASSTDPSTWRPLDVALETYTKHQADGIGFVLGDGYAGIDLDDCRDPQTGAIQSWATVIITEIDSYTEISPSGTGVKIFLHGTLAQGRRKGPVEMYGGGRYFTVTGLRVEHTPAVVEDRQLALEALHARLFPPQAPTEPPRQPQPVAVDDVALLERARAAINGHKFDRLYAGDWSAYSSQSEADLALCSRLAFWTGKDHGRMDRLFRSSGLMRPKWDSRHGAHTYGHMTVEKAIAGCHETYQHGSTVPTSSLGEPTTTAAGVTLDDFHAFMPTHSYVFAPSREMWPASSVNARIPPIPVPLSDGTPVLDDKGKPKQMAASTWLDRHRSIEQMTWVPGMPMLVRDRLVSDGGWIPRPGCTTFNLYRPPQIELGDSSKAGAWIDHIYTVYPEDAGHIIPWLAHRVQRPSEKVNHAIVLGGAQGIGKDTLLEPVKHAIGPWNFAEVSPQHLLGRFNSFVKSVILRVSEARDLGDVDRYSFYDHLKTYTAAPPDVLRVDEKHLREYAAWNVCGVVITTNHRTDGLYLPADDRRHYVAWSERSKTEFQASYWTRLYSWYADGGTGHVAAFLAEYDLSTFDAKAPPPKTAAFYDCVDANRAPEDAELADALDRLEKPVAVTLADIAGDLPSEFSDWLRDRKNARQIPHRLETAGYVAVRNPNAKDGLWSVKSRRQVIYARHDVSVRDRLAAAGKIAATPGNE